ncbi:MAG: TetR family transcriptional regulator [Burkholderiales bacterium]|nr:TetR family transcriptional regulator [Burkholderiales bacterium]
MRALAEASGFTKPGIYYHFRGKEELLRAVCAGSIAGILREVERSAAERDPARRIRTVIRAHVGFFMRHPHRLTVLNREMERLGARSRRAIERLERRYLDTLRRLLERGTRRGAFRRLDPSVAAFLLLTMLNGLDAWYDPRGAVGEEGLVRHIETVFLTGVLRRPAAAAPRAPARPSPG